jgi:hypothetical protein
MASLGSGSIFGGQMVSGSNDGTLQFIIEFKNEATAALQTLQGQIQQIAEPKNAPTGKLKEASTAVEKHTNAARTQEPREGAQQRQLSGVGFRGRPPQGTHAAIMLASCPVALVVANIFRDPAAIRRAGC